MAAATNFEQDLLRLVSASLNGNSPLPGATPVTALRQADPGSLETPENAGVQPGTAIADLSRELSSLRQQLGAAEETAKRQADLLEQNTRILLESASRTGSTVGNAASNVLSSARDAGGLGILASPLAGLLGRLFGGREDPAPAALTQFTLPPPIREELGVSAAAPGLEPVTYRADGIARTTSASVPAPTTITVQVQTMDSRSFLDNSDQIARAVREAMLNSHPLNDVIGDM
jgi:hypothetical protein